MNVAELNARLLRGAKVLGDFWKSGQRCPEGWGISDIKVVEGGPDCGTHRDCACEKKTDFCKARVHWINLALQAGRPPLMEDQGIPFLMSSQEWDATGVILKYPHPEVGEIRIGTGPGAQISMLEFTRICDIPETMASFLKLFKVFPGSQVVGREQAPPPPQMEPTFVETPEA